MKTTLLIKQHQKCLEILKMITHCEMRISDAEWMLRVSRNGFGPVDYGPYYFGKELKYNAIRSRLINYYANTFTKMCQNVNV